MNDRENEGQEHPRWQYGVLWRYGALVLVVVGLLAMGFGAANFTGAPVSVTLLPIGFVSLIAGVVLPRIEGKFTAGPTGLSAEMLAVHELDRPRFSISGPAFASDARGDEEDSEAEARHEPCGPRITIGDVWDALEAAGIRADGVGLGHAYFVLRGDHTLDIPNRSFADWGVASDDLLSVLETWGIHPVASGKYTPDRAVRPDYADRRMGSLRNLPRSRG